MKKNQSKLKKVLSLLSATAVAITMLQTAITFISASADITGTYEVKSISFGTADILGKQKNEVFFGSYKQSGNANGGYNTDPIQWTVLSNANGKLFLLSHKNIDVFQYNTAGNAITWQNSTIRSWLNGYDASYNTAHTDYSADNFIGTAFSATEQASIAYTDVINATYNGTIGNPNPDYSTSGGNDTSDKIFFLSVSEALNGNYNFYTYSNNDSSRVSSNTDYVSNGGKIGSTEMSSSNENDLYWLRTPGQTADSAVYISKYGAIKTDGISATSTDIAVRPAFNLNNSDVLFTSLAQGGKNQSLGLEEVVTYQYPSSTDPAKYKLTLLDSSRSEFKASMLKTSTKTIISYSGATTGQNEYISAIIKDADGNAKYYGRLKNILNEADSSGIIDCDFSGKINSSDTLYIFNEQYNGDYMTDYASNLKEIPSPNSINAYNIVFETDNGTINGDYESIYVSGNKTKLPTDVTKNDCFFVGWYENSSFSGNAVTEISEFDTGNKVYYAKWFNYDELETRLEQAVSELDAAINSNTTDISTINGKINDINAMLSSLGDTYETTTEVQEKISAAKTYAVNEATRLVQEAENRLNTLIANKADASTLANAITTLQNTVAELELVKTNYAAADTQLRDDLEAQITTAQSSAVNAARLLVEAAKSELNATINQKADISTVNAKINNLQNAVNALESVVNDYASADSKLKTELEAQISSAQNAAVDAAKLLIEDAKNALNVAIEQKADTKTVNAAIENLQNAIDSLEAIKDDYATADSALKTELEDKISSAQSTLKTAIDSLSNELNGVKNELGSLKNELEEKNDKLLTFTIVVCVISSVALVGVGAFATWFFVFYIRKR